MKEAELNLTDDKVKEQANHYIDRIFVELSRFQRHGAIEMPTIIMSMDVFDVLQAGKKSGLNINCVFQTICGCKVDIISGTKKLYVGLNLLEQESNR